MSVEQYKNLPNLVKEILEALLSVSADIQASWSDARRARYEQFCNAITGEGSTDMGWSIEEWVDTLRNLQLFVERVGYVLQEIENHGCPPSNWTEDENEVFELLVSRIPQPSISEQDYLKSEMEDVVKQVSEGKITRRAFIGKFASYTINDNEVFCLPHKHSCGQRHPREGRDLFVFKYTKE